MDLFQKITGNTTLLTPNRRLAASLLKEHQLAQKKLSWQSLDILPLPSWLERLWRECAARELTDTQLLLSPNQEQVLWEDILRNSPESEGLLQVSRTSELAKSAWGILKQWQVDLNNPAFKTTEDNSAFQKWGKQFQNITEQHNWIDTSSLGQKIIEKIENGSIIPPEHIILIGFTEISPLQKNIISACEAHGSQITYHETTFRHESAARISLTDTETEIRTMARWAKSLLNSKTAKIGCVIPNLEDKRDQVIKIFSDVFSEKNTYTLNYTDLPFNISAGKSLAAYPIVHTALQLLNLHKDTISLTTLSNLLRSPFLGEAENERMRRANYDSRLRSANVITLSVKKLLSAQEDKYSLPNSCPALAKRLEEYFKIIAENKKKLPISTWVTLFIDLLKILGWPGERSLNSPEYQIIQHCWLPLLTQYATYDSVLPPQSYSSALHFLTRLTASTVFQPQSPEAPIQILGMLEAAELPFDYLWISGLDDTAWPSPAKPNPFIPHRLQKTLSMPNSSPERELIYCKKLTEQLMHSAQHVIFSNAMQTDKAELRPSALIKNIKEITLDQLSLSDFISPADSVFQIKELETLCDDHAPAISDQEPIRGGASIFKLQAACPFKAFAEIRLHAAKIDTPTLGLRPQDRGNIMHKALEFIWHDLKDLETLHSQDQHQLQELVHTYAKKAIYAVNKEKIETKRYLTLELERLKKLLHIWLDLEKLRPNFKVIFREEERLAKIGNIDVKLRVDRIDELDNGTQLIIDYKTGKSNQIKHWFDERPEEPQLPLYCVTDRDKTIGIAFAEIHPDSMKIKGVSKTDLQITGIQVLADLKISAATWDEQVDQWQRILEKLANDFCQGQAQVDPKNLEETCRYCNLQALCRINEKI